MVRLIDGPFFRILNREAATPLLDWFMPRVTNLHHQAWFLILVAAVLTVGFLLGGTRTRVWIVCLIAAVGCSDAFASHVVKRMIPRDRPCYRSSSAAPMHVRTDRLVAGTHCPGSRSFPSNHATNMMAVAAVCIRFGKTRKKWLWLLLPLVIGYSRVYLGFHYPTDIIGGWLFGGCIGWLSAEVGLRWLTRRDGRKLALPSHT